MNIYLGNLSVEQQEIFDRLKNYAFKGQIGIGVMEDEQ